jgi:hypothetical protein
MTFLWNSWRAFLWFERSYRKNSKGTQTREIPSVFPWTERTLIGFIVVVWWIQVIVMYVLVRPLLNKTIKKGRFASFRYTCRWSIVQPLKFAIAKLYRALAKLYGAIANDYTHISCSETLLRSQHAISGPIGHYLKHCLSIMYSVSRAPQFLLPPIHITCRWFSTKLY